MQLTFPAAPPPPPPYWPPPGQPLIPSRSLGPGNRGPLMNTHTHIFIPSTSMATLTRLHRQAYPRSRIFHQLPLSPGLYPQADLTQ